MPQKLFVEVWKISPTWVSQLKKKTTQSGKYKTDKRAELQKWRFDNRILCFIPVWSSCCFAPWVFGEHGISHAFPALGLLCSRAARQLMGMDIEHAIPWNVMPNHDYFVRWWRWWTLWCYKGICKWYSVLQGNICAATVYTANWLILCFTNK